MIRLIIACSLLLAVLTASAQYYPEGVSIEKELKLQNVVITQDGDTVNFSDGGGSGETAILDQTLDKDTLYVKVCNEAGDTCKYVGFVDDTSSSSSDVSLGSYSQIPFMNADGTDLEYLSSFGYNKTTGVLSVLNSNSAQSSLVLESDFTMISQNNVLSFRKDSDIYFYINPANGSTTFVKDVRFTKPVTIENVLHLTPREAPPTPSEGDIYMDLSTHKLRVYDGTTWQDCW